MDDPPENITTETTYDNRDGISIRNLNLEAYDPPYWEKLFIRKSFDSYYLFADLINYPSIPPTSLTIRWIENGEQKSYTFTDLKY